MATGDDKGGLEGVVVADTRLSDVDGEAGRLVIAGRDVEDLARDASFEEAYAALRTAAGLGGLAPADLGRALGAQRARAFAVLPRPSLSDGMEALRAALASLASSDVAGPEEDVAVCAAVPVAVASWARLRRGLAPVAPDASLSHAADTLRMLTGAAPGEAEARALGAYLVTVCDHGMNASTFAARVVASTGSDVVSCVVAAVGALKGPLHGGAPGPVLDMLDAIGEPSRAAAWIEGELAAGRRLMGMGHRVYRVRDPRAAVLEAATRRLRAAGVRTLRLELARAVEEVASSALARKYPQRSLEANVELYTAVLLDAVGLDRALFTPMFAVGRVAGWTAHVAEQRARGRLIRPASRYVGERALG